MMSPLRLRSAMPLGVVMSPRTLLFEQCGAAHPALRHPVPKILVALVAGELGHTFAFIGVSKEFV